MSFRDPGHRRQRSLAEPGAPHLQWDRVSRQHRQHVRIRPQEETRPSRRAPTGEFIVSRLDLVPDTLFRTLAFYCSQVHADFMSQYFREAGVDAVAVHAGESSAPRAASLQRLRDGELEVIFSVDMFNEGVDLPDVDTILMLRPTESKILWLQQFGRGLRQPEVDKTLKVVDYIGNHRVFLNKPAALLHALFSMEPGL